MATATIVSGTEMTTIDEATVNTNWGGDTFVANTTAGINGTCMEVIQTTNGNNDVYVTGSWNFTTPVHLRLWFNLLYFENFAASNPIQVFMYDGTNTDYWYWDPGDTYQGGWEQAVIYTGLTPDVDNSANHAAITRIGMRVVTSTKPRNAPFNALYDAWRYGDGYTITGGTNGDEIDWSHIATTDAASAYGIVTEERGIYTLRGSVQIGDGVSTTYFKPEGQLAVFQEEQVLSTLYNLTFFDDASNVTNVEYIGGALASGSIATGGTLRFDLDANLTDFNAFSMSGVQIGGADTSSFPDSASYSVTNCVFDDCNQIDCQLSVFTGHTIKNSTDTGGALLYPSSDANCHTIIFENNDNDVEYDATSDSSSPTFVDCTFDDSAGNYDVNNTSTAAITINNNNSNANSYNPAGDAVTFVTSVDINVDVEDSAGNAVEDVQVYIQKSAAGKQWNYVSHSGNTAGDVDFVVTGAIDTDIPQTGWIHVLDTSANVKQNYRYASWSTSTDTTFVLNTEVTGTANTAGSGTTLKWKTGSTGFDAQDIEEGDTIRNTTDGSWAVVDEIVSNTEITTTQLQGGGDNTWSENDAYSLHKLALTYTITEDIVDVPLMNTQTDATGDADSGYNWGALATPLPITIRIRSNNDTTNKYLPYNTSGTITASGYSLTAVLSNDEVAQDVYDD